MHNAMSSYVAYSYSSVHINSDCDEIIQLFVKFMFILKTKVNAM